MNPFLLTLLLSFLIQLLFASYAIHKITDKVTDLSYSLTFLILALITFVTTSIKSDPQILLVLMILLWSLRLAGYLFIRILTIHKDSRFDHIRSNPLKFASFWFFQAITVWIIILPTTTILSSSHPINFSLTMIAGFSIWLTGFLIETIADQQKFLFKTNPKNHDLWISTGLWKYSRHPNYFGEILVWWGIFIYSLPYLSGLSILTITSPLFITYLLLFVTGIPPLEKSHQIKYGASRKFQHYTQTTSLLIPLPPKSKTS